MDSLDKVEESILGKGKLGKAQSCERGMLFRNSPVTAFSRLGWTTGSEE